MVCKGFVIDVGNVREKGKKKDKTEVKKGDSIFRNTIKNTTMKIQRK